MASIKKPIIYIASDHAGFQAKQGLIPLLKQDGYQVVDFGCHHDDKPTNYAIRAIRLAKKVAQAKEPVTGILICGSGIGVAMAANKVQGILCGVAYSEETARLIKEHDNCNILALGGQHFSIDQLYKFVTAYLNAEFEAGRHLPRVGYIAKYEKKPH